MGRILRCPSAVEVRTGHDASRERVALIKNVRPEVAVQTFKVPSARDTVLVARIEGGGLISYRRADGKHLHTLNTDEGFERKLVDLGIEI